MEINKYYSIKHKLYQGLYYFRIKQIIGNYVYPDGYYINNMVFTKCSEGFWIDIKNDSWEIEEVSSSVILKMLPLEHPDKIVYLRKEKLKLLLK